MENQNKLTTFNLQDSTAKIKVLTVTTAENIIKIGKEMLQVKANLSYGEFTKWLKNEVNYSQRTAYNFMKIAQTFPDLQPVANFGVRKLLILAGLEDEEKERVVNDYDLKNMTVKELKEVIDTKKKLESIQLLMEILSTEVTKTGFDYDSVPNMDWDIDILTGKKRTLEEVKETQKEVEKLIVEDVNQIRSYWYKYIEDLRKDSDDDKNFVKKFYDENIMGKIKGNKNGDSVSYCYYLYWNIILTEYIKNKGVEQ